MSVSGSVPEHRLELESQFFLRLPLPIAEELRKAVRSGEPLAKRLTFEWDRDIRHNILRFDKHTLVGRLMDLPTITESYKTLDRKNFYKTADICQILICREDTAGAAHHSGTDEQRKEKYNTLFADLGGAGKREYQYPHGITPPLKNVRKRRFRKTLKKKYVDFSEIEKEVKRLLKFDCEAIDVRYEIVEESRNEGAQGAGKGVADGDTMASEAMTNAQSAENSQSLDVHDLFGEESSGSSSDDDDELETDNQNDMDDDRMDDDDDDEPEDAPVPSTSQAIQPPEPAPPVVRASDIADEIAAASDLIAQNDNDDTDEKNQELNRELVKIRERILTQESEMRGLDNQALRMRLQPVLDRLHEQEAEIMRQLDELANRGA